MWNEQTSNSNIESILMHNKCTVFLLLHYGIQRYKVITWMYSFSLLVTQYCVLTSSLVQYIHYLRLKLWRIGFTLEDCISNEDLTTSDRVYPIWIAYLICLASQRSLNETTLRNWYPWISKWNYLTRSENCGKFFPPNESHHNSEPHSLRLHVVLQ